MRILFIADPLEHFKIYKDTTFAMMEEAHRRGHAVSFAEAHQLSVEGGRILVDAVDLTVTDERPHWYKLGQKLRQPLQAFSAVIMRKDPPFDMEYLYASQLFSLAEQQGVKVFTSGQALRDFNEKLAILQFPDLTAPTLITAEAHRLRAFVNQHQDAIFKPLDSMGGDSIFRVRPDDANLSVIIETITQRGRRTIMAQRYIPEIRDGDKRILVIDGVPVDYCLARIPAAGETRGNLAAGGRGEARPLSARDREIAETVGPELKKRGILLAGLDVIGNYLTEVNVTSPTCFREIMDQSGINVAGLYIDALERHCQH
ncbi:glutathione synthase [Chromobacterium alticapitis]|uniref:Glutathione synthetase n=1 Tax=Chromobacterium alticapitis TaxID=2073169 RepID=A0A2S5DJR8_9NEIS|nr:glutathione synthase [Chromobacterium alticapitis]POZ63242.1 glutathione synthase [Chromobacterium alticapitis]